MNSRECLRAVAMFMGWPDSIPSAESLEQSARQDRKAEEANIDAILSSMPRDIADRCEEAALALAAAYREEAYEDGMKAGARLALELLGVQLPEVTTP